MGKIEDFVLHRSLGEGYLTGREAYGMTPVLFEDLSPEEQAFLDKDAWYAGFNAGTKAAEIFERGSEDAFFSDPEMPVPAPSELSDIDLEVYQSGWSRGVLEREAMKSQDPEMYEKIMARWKERQAKEATSKKTEIDHDVWEWIRDCYLTAFPSKPSYAQVYRLALQKAEEIGVGLPDKSIIQKRLKSIPWQIQALCFEDCDRPRGRRRSLLVQLIWDFTNEELAENCPRDLFEWVMEMREMYINAGERIPRRTEDDE